MLNKKTIALSALLASSLVASSAFASEFYVGADAKYAITTFKKHVKNDFSATFPNGKLKTKAPGMGVFFGYGLSDNLFMEIGYENFKSRHHTTSANTSLNTKSRNLRFDFIGSYAISNNFDLIGSAGLGLHKLESSYRQPGFIAADTYTKLGPRLGGGVKYKITDSFSTRFMANVQRVGGKNDKLIDTDINYHTTFNLGFIYEI